MHSLVLFPARERREARMSGVDMPGSAIAADVAPPVGNVAVTSSQVRRYRAVLSRSVTLKTVVEFDAPETADRYAIAEQLAGEVPIASYEIIDGGYAYVDNVEVIDDAADAPMVSMLSSPAPGRRYAARADYRRIADDIVTAAITNAKVDLSGLVDEISAEIDAALAAGTDPAELADLESAREYVRDMASGI